MDTSPTVAQTKEIAGWIDKTIADGCKVKYFWTTHAHGDHFLGFPVLKKRYPGIKALATATVLEALKPTYEEATLKYWQGLFVDSEVPGEHPDFEVIGPNGIELDGHVLKAYDVIQGDSEANSFMHVPDLALVVAGDLVYGDCHQYLREANTKGKRENWIKAVEQIESLKPQIVVPGHTRSSQIPGAYLTASTKEYIRVFGEELEKTESAVALERKMKQLYPERWNDGILQFSCESAFAAKGS
jgi:glyoxylase-like metal-dependent hydrolase (beta-lactamase superfamily II)